MKDLLILFLLDGVLGYYLQAVSYIVMIYACNSKKLSVSAFFFLTVPFGFIAYGLRHIDVISFGFYTILLIVSFVLVSVFVLKFKTFPTVIATLLTTMLILLSEILVIAVLSLTVGENVIQSDGTIEGDIRKSLYGVPVNVILTAVSATLYRIRLHNPGKRGGKEPANDRNTGA